MAGVSHTILQDADPKDWQLHRFGLSEQRWHALSGKAIWITGAGTGFGRCMAIALAAAGAQIFLSGRRAHKLDETITEIAALGITTPSIHPVPVDITEPVSVDAAVSTIRDYCPHLYGLINNAALPFIPTSKSPLADTPPQVWQELMATNVTAQWLVTQAALPHMIAGDTIRVLFISSEAGWNMSTTPGFGPYKVSKAALNCLGASFAAECAECWPDADIQMNVLVPGEGRTEMNKGSPHSPFSIVSMALTLLSHPPGGPNGCFFHRDGRHLPFGRTEKFDKPLF